MKLRIVLLAVLVLALGLGSATQAQSNVEGFETGDFSSLPWSVSYWRVTSEVAYSGDYSAAAYSTSTGVLEVTLTTGAGQISFWRYSDDNGWLKFYIDGVLTDNWSSMSSTWIQESFPVSAGTHTFRWEASSSGSNDNDVYIDDIAFPGIGGSAEQSITQDYAIDGDTVTSTVTFGAPITGGTFDLYLTGDFDDSGECYTLTIEGTTVYDECASNIGFQDASIATTRGGAHSLGTFPLPDSAIGKTSITVVGETTSEVNNSNDPAARAWIVIHAFPGMGSFSGLEGFETGDFSKFPWQTGGDAPWFITSFELHTGTYAAKPSTIENTEKSWLQVTLNIATSGEISFWYRVSSESDHDFLQFSIDDEEAGRWSGDTGWQQASFPVPSGSHTFRWKYAKDGSGSWGKDTAYLDDITFPTAAVSLVLQPTGVPQGMALIPEGSFEMGDSFNEGESDERPVHTVTVSAFYMDRYEVTNDEMVEVMQWAYDNAKITVSASTVRNATGDQQELLDLDDSDCRITWSGSAFGLKSAKGSGYPCVEVTWYGAAAFCNYRSEKEGLAPCYNLSDWSCNWSANGYRLPTEAEWEYAARGGAAGHRFPWSDTDTIQHSRANYYSSSSYSYDTSPTRRFHPDYATGGYPYTSPVGSFAPDGYGLYDMVGNVWEWCWDWYDGDCYEGSPGTDPRGPASGSRRVDRGGGWGSSASLCRVASRYGGSPDYGSLHLGFRLVRAAP